MLFEDAVVLRDDQALAALFEDSAVLVVERQAPACGGEAIARLALARWNGEHTYIADPQCVVQAHDIALIVAERSINVAYRDHDGTWHYAIVFVRCDTMSTQQEPMGYGAGGDATPDH